jgi:CheY-like chemotaxis protein
MARRVVAATGDMFFASKIDAVARAAGVSLSKVETADGWSACLEDPAPDLVVVDLNSAACMPLDAIRRLKGDARTADIPTLGFLSHVQVELERAALDAGCDRVIPRSKFSARLADYLLGQLK